MDFTEKLPDGIPDASALVAELRAADPSERPAIIARYPVLETYAPMSVLARWVGMKEQSAWVARSRLRADGSLGWPDEDDTVFGRKVWKFSTIALHRAALPGRGHNLTTAARVAGKYGG